MVWKAGRIVETVDNLLNQHRAARTLTGTILNLSTSAQIAEIEKKLGIYDLSKFTP